jgi:cytoskeletal protein CcmA (bactofilin family)
MVSAHGAPAGDTRKWQEESRVWKLPSLLKAGTPGPERAARRAVVIWQSARLVPVANCEFSLADCKRAVLVDNHQIPMPEKETTLKEGMSTTPSASKNVLASDVEIKGNLKFAGELTFEGKLDGEIQSDGTLNLGDSAVVNGNINVQSVVVRGKVNGNIVAKEKIEIKAKAELFGDIRSAKLTIEEGVTFVGKTEVNPNKVAPTPPVRQAEAPRMPEPAKAMGR